MSDWEGKWLCCGFRDLALPPVLLSIRRPAWPQQTGSQASEWTESGYLTTPTALGLVLHNPTQHRQTVAIPQPTEIKHLADSALDLIFFIMDVESLSVD